MDKETIRPKVSVIMPNLNYRHYLKERIESVLNQTLTDIEYIIVDSYSDDGAWELIQEYAKKDSRMRISQAPRGIHWTCWNMCIQQANGEYIYIATSDDTMMPDCLEKMVSALDAHPECGICHCCLKAIDEKGDEIPRFWHNTLASKFYGEIMNKLHIRVAPYDAILYCALFTVYTSMAQLLIRRSVFEDVGLFQTHWGPEGDNEWEMRATLVYNTLHIPETLATFRIHPDQQTNPNNHLIPSFYASFRGMIKAAFKASSPKLKEQNPECYRRINMSRLLYPYTQEYIRLSLGKHDWSYKILFLLKLALSDPRCAGEYVCRRILKKLLNIRDFTYIRKELKQLGLEQNIKILE